MVGGAAGVVGQRHSCFLPSRARGARRFQRAPTQTDLLGPPGRRSGCWPHDGEVAGGAILFLADCCSQIRGDDGARAVRPMMTSASPVECSEVPGHRQRLPNSAVLTVGALAFACAARCGRCSERSAEFGSVDPKCNSHARAHNRKTRRLLTNRPCSSFSTKSPIPTNVYASTIGLCKDSMIMQSRKPSNSDFRRSFNI